MNVSLSFCTEVFDLLLKSSLIAIIGVCAIALPSEALPEGVPNQHCSQVSNPRPGTLCYVLHDNLGGKATAGGSPQGGELVIQPQAGYYVVDFTAIEVTSQAGNGAHNKQVLAVGSSVESISGYQSRLTEVDRVINELEGKIAAVAASAVYEAKNKLTYLRERRAEYATFYQTAVSASRNAPTTRYSWSAASRSCGWLNLDTCGSWINFRVYEVRKYLGDPVAEYNTRLLPAMEQAQLAVQSISPSLPSPQASPLPSPQVNTSINYCNHTSDPIYTTYVAYNQSSGWQSRGWFEVSPQQCKDISLGIYNGDVYVYGMQGSTFWGDGDTSFCVDQINAFTINNSDIFSCSGGNYKKVPMTRLSVNSGQHTWNMNSGTDPTPDQKPCLVEIGGFCILY